MLDFVKLKIKRAITHQITDKEEGQEHSNALLSDEIMVMNNNVSDTIVRRLIKASHTVAKSFELEIEDTLESSFYGLCRRCKGASDDQFIEISGKIAYLLAAAQKGNNVPGGYLIFMECNDDANNHAWIAIKAELHEALRYSGSNLEYLNDVFLSPAQRMYKVGAVYEKPEPEEGELPHSHYGSFLFDNQFRIDSKPAEYFYRDFLGFSIDNNPKIQSKRFYDSTESFILDYVEEPDDKNAMLQALTYQFNDEEQREIDPLAFAQQYFNDDELMNNYAMEVSPYLPQNIVKDASLIKSKLDWKKMYFPNKVSVSGPNKTFEFDVQIVNNLRELEALDFQTPNFTVVKILGRPFQKM